MIKILLVDDEPLEREGLKILIKSLLNTGVCFDEASSGRKALSKISSFDPDIIFMDIKMPGLNGIEASKQIKKHSDVVIIILSAYDDFHLLQQSIRLGIDDYILKPPKLYDLEEVLAKYLKKNKVYKEERYINNPRETSESSESNESTKISYMLKPLIEHINQKVHSDISLEEGAALINITPSYLSKLFKSEMGINFTQYVTKKKVERAKLLLINSDLPISDIALDLNFNEVNYFCKVFKKSEGMTPTEYRRRGFGKIR